MKRINKKTDLPSWFDINRYDILNDLSDEDLLNQIIVRRDSIKINSDIFFRYPEMLEIAMPVFIKNFSSIIRPLDTSSFKMEKASRKKYSEQQMSGIGGIEPLKLIEVVHLAKKANDYIDIHQINRSLRGQKRAVSKTISHNGDMFVNLDLSWPDEILLKDMERLLPLWRQELGVTRKDEEKANNNWLIIKKKIIDYKIIPLLDLMEWASVMNFNITNRVLALVVYPNGEYDSTNIAQTIKPFIENLLGEFSIEKLKRKIDMNLKWK